MSNFFRDSSMGFKQRPNIFSKMRVKETGNDDGAKDNGEMMPTTDADSSMLDDLFLESAAKNETENTNLSGFDNKQDLAFQLAMSTPHANKNNALEEDDLEITAIRDVNFTKPESKVQGNSDTFKEGDEEQHNQLSCFSQGRTEIGKKAVDSSSNDVLLEAFTNTQRICGNLKQQLQKEQNDNMKLRTRIKSYEADTGKLVDKFSSYRNLLDSLNEKSKWLLEQKKLNDSEVEELKRRHKNVQDKIADYKRDISDLKNTISACKVSKCQTDTEIAKKTKEIEYLTKQLDECAGALSEEKIKNSELMKENIRTKEELRKIFVEKFEEQKVHTRTLFTEWNDNLKNVYETNIIAQFLKSEDKIISSLQQNINISGEKLLHENKSVLRPLLADIENATKNVTKETLTKLDDIKNVINNGDINILQNIIQSKEIYEQQIKKISETILEEITKNNAGVNSLTNDVLQTLQSYQNEMVKTEDCKKEIDKLQKENVELEIKKRQALTSLGTKEAEHEEAQTKLAEIKNEIAQVSKRYEEVQQDLKRCSEQLSCHKQKLARSSEDNSSMKANYDNKLAAQGSIIEAITSERDALKKRIEELTANKEHMEKESTHKVNSIQKSNEKLQQLNIEIVQLKAHELELEEENRSIKRALEEKHYEYEETTGSLDRYKQKIIILETEKQNIVSEKLELKAELKILEEKLAYLKQKNIASAKTAVKPPPESHTKSLTNIIEAVPYARQACKNSSKISSHTAPKPKITAFAQHKRDLQSRNKPDLADDEFDLSSSLNEDFELTGPSLIEIKTTKATRGSTQLKSNTLARKKLLLLEDDESSRVEHKKRKKRG